MSKKVRKVISFHFNENNEVVMLDIAKILVILVLLIFGVSSVSGASILSKEDFNVYGYVDTSYTQNFNNPSNGANGLRIFDIDSNSFRTHLAQMVFEREGKADGKLKDRAGFRIKLNYGEDAQLTSGSIVGDVTPGGSTADDFDFQEAYAQFIAPVGNGIDFRVGKMNTLIGYEVIESPLNPNFSRSWLFGLGEPFTTTGIRASYAFNDQVALSVGGINSFTGAQTDANSGKSVEALLSLTPTDFLGVSIFGFWGPEGARGAKDSDRLMIGGIVDVQVTDQTEVVIEGYYGNQANATPGRNARWNGVAGYLIHDFNDQWGIRLRGEVFEDAAGFFSGTAQTLWEITPTLQYKPFPSLITRVEFRYDKSDQKPFFDGVNPEDDQTTLAGEVIFLF